ncbi:carboxypeptidase-like regulatory domain-containing protein [Maribacter luteus]|uniref:carboxypeptidase-like regulatory domain-containing protein n=1 Tax=Maribacter luteus TaxID=2594478 RepID=UPI001FE4CFA3|nr:carboxypeptidase-like regulatory domain-containing protein [Maribacter luteus]
MKCPKTVFLLFFLCLFANTKAQTATITGIVFDENNDPLPAVNITSLAQGTTTDEQGYYLLHIVADQENKITFSHVGHGKVILEGLILNSNEIYEFNPVLNTKITQIEGVTISASGEKKVEGIKSISPQMVRKIPGANAGVENILKLLPSVTSNNELSTQYSVRGGNYDENLVYINEIEVYRPFLIRAAQQEGLSIVNSDLVRKVEFSAGGFQAKYGDKLSSVLDITYKNPTEFGAQLDVSLLGASLAMETLSKNKKISNVTGIRYRNNSLLVNSQQTNTNFKPTFADVQSYLTYRISNKIHLDFFGNLSINDYQNEPLDRQTNFGTISDPKTLLIRYSGSENNRYATALGAIKANYHLNESVTLKLISSLYHTTEEEYSDVVARYAIGQVNTDLGSENLGDVTIARGVGGQFSRARNELDALIFNLEQSGIFSTGKKKLQWGIKYTHEDIRDQLRESVFLDSAGFSVRPPFAEYVNNQPETPFVSPLVPYQGISARNFVKTNRLSAYTQFGESKSLDMGDMYYNIGVRTHYWHVGGKGISNGSQIVFSPRGQFSFKPKWKKDMLFRTSIGVYHQPPFYRELRDATGNINPDVKAQKSIHYVIGNEYSFELWERPFTLISEAYYKKLDNVNPYTLNDVRIRYAAENNAKAYTYGAEVRLNGAFVPGTESWVSLGYLQTKENIDNQGYIPRPTDQRLKLGILFQDYVPTIPNLKMYLNLIYNTGVPGGSPSYADPYDFQNRLRDYKRADLGISHIFVSAEKRYPKNHWLHRIKELSLGFEIFNLFNNQNSITNTWVKDVESKNEFAVPNYMTSRVLNLRLKMRM